MKILLDEVPVAGLPTSAIKTFVDRTPPTVHVELAPPTLPAPTCEFVPVSANIIVEDNLDPVPLAALSRITFDGADVPDDVRNAEVGDPDGEFELRAVPNPDGSSRVYTIVRFSHFMLLRIGHTPRFE